MSKYTSAYHFKSLVVSSQSFHCNGCVRFVYNFSKDSYLYLMISKKYGNAPNRNIFKRRARQLFDGLVKEHAPLPLGLMIKPLKQNVSYQDLQTCFGVFNKKIILQKN